MKFVFDSKVIFFMKVSSEFSIPAVNPAHPKFKINSFVTFRESG